MPYTSKLIYTIGLIAAILSGCSTNIEEKLATGVRAEQAGKIELATKLYTEIAETQKLPLCVVGGEANLFYNSATDHLAAAERWFNSGAKENIPACQARMGQVAEMKGDYRTAIDWFNLAVKGGESRAAYGLALHHIRGDYLPRDLKKAELLAYIAKKGGHPGAEALLTGIREIERRTPSIK